MQLGWRKDDVRSLITLALYHNTPPGETWQGLRKGGMAGMYVVIMALSWWIKAQLTQRDAEVWSSIEDVSWVLQQIKQTVASRVPPKKRARDDREEMKEGQQKKR